MLPRGLSLVLTLTFIITSSCEPCKPSKRKCVAWNQYQSCVNVLDNAQLVGEPQLCPEGTLCDDLGYFPCIAGTTPPPPLTTIPPPACFAASKYQSSICNQYYECVPVLWWWEPRLLVCPSGEYFDPYTLNCETDVHSTCVITTTSIPPTIPPPACYGAGRHSATSCNQYYECVQNWWWWEPRLLTCPEGEGYNSQSEECQFGYVCSTSEGQQS